MPRALTGADWSRRASSGVTKTPGARHREAQLDQQLNPNTKTCKLGPAGADPAETRPSLMTTVEENPGCPVSAVRSHQSVLR